MVEHVGLGRRPGIHEQLYILRHPARKRIQGQQVFRRVVRAVLREDLLQHGRGKRTHGHKARLPVVQRFFLVFEYLRHQRINRPADNQVDTGFRAVHVPNALHIAVHRFVHAEKLLKFVDEQCDGAFCRELHQELEYIGETLRPAYRRDTQFVLYFALVILAQIALGFAGDEEIENRLLLVCLPHERGLADTATSRDYRKLGVFLGQPVNLPQGGDLFRSVEKSHYILPVLFCMFRNNRFRNSGFVTAKVIHFFVGQGTLHGFSAKRRTVVYSPFGGR